LLHQLIPIVALVRFVTKVLNRPLPVGHGHAEGGAGLAAQPAAVVVRHPLFNRQKVTGGVRFGKLGNSAGGAEESSPRREPWVNEQNQIKSRMGREKTFVG